MVVLLVVCSHSVFQIGNVAVFFKVVDNSTTYDLLDVYLDRWEEVAEEVAENCAAVSGTNARRGLRNPGPSNARARRAFSTNEELSDFLDRDYHPYDFYKSTNTEVSVLPSFMLPYLLDAISHLQSTTFATSAVCLSPLVSRVFTGVY